MSYSDSDVEEEISRSRKGFSYKKMAESQLKPIQVYVSPQMREKILRLCKKLEVSFSTFGRLAVISFYKKQVNELGLVKLKD